MREAEGRSALKYEDKTPLANLHLTLLERAGIPVDKFGNSTQLFSDL